MPDGSTERCKVLSNSSLRGTARIGRKSNQVVIDLEYSLPDQFFNQYRFSNTAQPDKIFKIVDYNSESNLLTIDQDLITPASSDSFPFEIKSNEEAPVLAIRIITKTPLSSPFPPLELRLSTTKGTNALLERSGSRSLMLITKGFGDLLHIKNQQRPDLFTLDIKKTPPFYHQIIEVEERIDANGNIISELNTDLLRAQLKPLVSHYESVGVCLMHSYFNPTHEQKIAAILDDLGFHHISVSSELSPAIKIVPRATTTDVNAYLSPIMEQYLNKINRVLIGNSMRVMTSAGSLTEVDAYKPKEGLLSGPAGGIIGAAAIGKKHGHSKIISFDMGGTSTDVSRFDGKIDFIFEHAVGDALLSAPAVDIETIAAGGGSICGFDGQSLTVGPESAGADPGPACYGRGGPLTITDVNLLSGKLHPANFHISISKEAAEQKFEKLLTSVNEHRKSSLSPKEVLEGLIEIANERMAQAIKKISIQKGFDPQEYTLVSFGGAGAQHALKVAEKLSISDVLIPSDAGLLSAYGLFEARLEEIESRQILKNLTDVEDNLDQYFRGLEERSVEKLTKQTLNKNSIEITARLIYLRYSGQDTSLEINWSPDNDLLRNFEQNYLEKFGHQLSDRSVEVESIRVVASEIKDHIGLEEEQTAQTNESDKKPTEAHHGRTIYYHKTLSSGERVHGPALILDPFTTTAVEEGWAGVLLNDGSWHLTHQVENDQHSNERTERSEEINLQLFTNRFKSVADQMGEMLQKTSLSVNVKERLDFSCALLDRDGYLVVNAPHIPVHLGAMGTCTRSILAYMDREPKLGDIYVTNHPAFGGSHLPDVTVVTPVFHNDERIGFVASRAHHAEIGGKRPGSMPPDATNLAEEGVVIPPSYLAKDGEFKWDEIKERLQSARWPTRSLNENLADLRAAVSANHKGVIEIQKLAEAHGSDQIVTYMEKLKNYASARMEATLGSLPDEIHSTTELLDDASQLSVKCTITGNRLSIDFEGTSDVNPGNLNANPSIVNSVIMYLLRIIINEPLPLNDGLLEPVEIYIPKGMLNPDFSDDPAECPAVVGGNIEVSQRLIDTLIKAFKLSACSYGTMNNVLFGNDSFGYYETVAGGTGAGPDFDGADGVHQHMTNTRAADPEILELRYPVRLDRYEIRKNSGGHGKYKGGDGLIRELTFLDDVSLSVLSQHREVEPYGMDGGQNGITGHQWIGRKNGTIEKLDWRDGSEVKSGDRFIMLTPGGGGWGSNE